MSEALFYDVRQRELTWKNDVLFAMNYAQRHVDDLWSRATTLRLETLDDKRDEVPEFEGHELAELRSLYPELSMLSDGSLYEWFDSFQMECCYVTGWTAYRHDAFLFYLVGKVAGRQHDSDAAKEVGKYVAYRLLRGDSLDDALAFGRAANLYDTAILRLAQRIANAMWFLAEDKKATQLQGRQITTMSDSFRRARKYNGTLEK
jgi:hypothetical protein